MSTTLPASEDVLDLLALLPNGAPLSALVEGISASRQAVTPMLLVRAIPGIDADTARALQRCLHRVGVLNGAGLLDQARLALVAELSAYTAEVARILPGRMPPPASRLVITVADTVGPESLRNQLGLRPLVQLVEDVIRSARQEIIVGSPFWTSEALTALSPCIDGFQGRGGSFQLLTQGGRRAPTSLPAVRRFLAQRRHLGGGAKLLLFDGESVEGTDLVLHAKFVVADDHLGYLGSANMTHYGLEANFELGIRITGPEVRDLRAVLAALENAGYITRNL